jgi:hypothetical protein
MTRNNSPLIAPMLNQSTLQLEGMGGSGYVDQQQYIARRLFQCRNTPPDMHRSLV